jgi:mannose-6-phosphate isomerase-like protein (cupin superfamily)
MGKELLLKKADIITDVFAWGRLEWYARKNLNGADITLGFCYINPQMENAMHSHPNCDEVLYVVEGSIIHRLNGEELPMNNGDSLFIPQEAVHNAFNAGNTEAVLAISFTSGERETVNV